MTKKRKCTVTYLVHSIRCAVRIKGEDEAVATSRILAENGCDTAKWRNKIEAALAVPLHIPQIPTRRNRSRTVVTQRMLRDATGVAFRHPTQ